MKLKKSYKVDWTWKDGLDKVDFGKGKLKEVDFDGPVGFVVVTLSDRKIWINKECIAQVSFKE